MLYTPLERRVRTVYVPEDYIDRLARRAAAGTLFPAQGRVRTSSRRRNANHVRVTILDRQSAGTLGFNILDVWRTDNQTIHYRVQYRSRRGDRFREIWRSAPAPPFMVLILPVVGALAFIAPEMLLMPIFGLASGGIDAHPAMQPLGKRLKAIADDVA